MTYIEAKREPLTIPTYGLGAPEKNPLFFERRVYQGSCGKAYPVPFIDKVFDTPEAQTYDSVRLENEYVRLVMLPEIGGRIFLGQDKVNNDYDFFCRQDEIKPALVGLAGPWISGGVFQYIQQFQGHIWPGVVAAFVFGLWSPRTPRIAGVAALVLGPIFYFILQKTADIHNLHFLLQVLVDFIVLAGILGILTPVKPLKEPVTMPVRHEIETKTSGGVYLAGGAVILAVAVFYVIFW